MDGKLVEAYNGGHSLSKADQITRRTTYPHLISFQLFRLKYTWLTHACQDGQHGNQPVQSIRGVVQNVRYSTLLRWAWQERRAANAVTEFKNDRHRNIPVYYEVKLACPRPPGDEYDLVSHCSLNPSIFLTWFSYC